ncbi:hypothetical protein [Actinomadura rudentiformis]|uniref:Uncharacterized protein n=1 Tax=Actinomadura rudentiformis TaxID=359158 RepID=A0A6H9YLI2_9ACTN|nr:hypothetical protein [Actinomadura rudentiformis]KAB2347359.1 hypothetical protein F8566_20315 [Actinomadura rudentiformis]
MTSQNPPRDERFAQRELAALRRRLHALETTPRIGPWVAITLASGYSTSVAGGYTPSYRFRSRLEVELRGGVRKGTGAGGVGVNGFANGDTMATLPAEIRPAQTIHAVVVGATTGAAASYGVFRVIITSAGALQWHSGIAAAPGWIALDGIRYDLI